MGKIVALVVTYNRKELLRECLEALFIQDFLPSQIVVIDNNSTDGTSELFSDDIFLKKNNIVYLRMEKNLGGAGGFYEGIKFIHENLDYDWLWLMDDDTIPEKACSMEIANILSDKIINTKISFFASSVLGPDDEPMNVPIVSSEKHDNGYSNWYINLDKGIVSIGSATFVSLFINKEAIATVGYPFKDFFIWGDDTEFTLRLVKYFGPAYMVGKSKVIHKRANAKSLSIKNELNENRVRMYYYYYRNALINTQEYYGTKVKLKSFYSGIKEIFAIFFTKGIRYRSRKAFAIIQADFDYFFKRYDKEAFKNRIPKKGNNG